MRTRVSISAFGTRASLREKAMLSNTVMCGYSAYVWNTIAMSRSFGSRSLTTLPPIEISPLVTDSNPATIRRAVDLPLPEGPTSTRNSLSTMSRLRSWMTWTPLSYTLFT